MLSSTSQHALRALVQLALSPAGNSVLGHELAERACIPANFLAKIMLALRNAGFVAATRGQGGGYCLRKDPGDIRLIDVVQLFDPASLQSGCVLGEQHDCTDCEACAVHDVWKQIRQTYLGFLQRQTIAQLAQRRPLQTMQTVAAERPADRHGKPRAGRTRGS